MKKTKAKRPSAKKLEPQYRSEDKEACDFMKMVKEAFPKQEEMLFHICNEAGRSAISGGLLNRMGRKKGVSDYFLSIPSKHYHGLYIELKNSCGKVTPEQQEWIKKAQKHGYAAFVARGASEAFDLVSRYLKNAL